jgi:hypothetical protein
MSCEYGIYAEKTYDPELYGDYHSYIYKVLANEMQVYRGKKWGSLEIVNPKFTLIPLNEFEDFFKENPFFAALISHYDENHKYRRMNDWCHFIYACQMGQLLQPYMNWSQFLTYIEIFQTYDVYVGEVVKALKYQCETLPSSSP